MQLSIIAAIGRSGEIGIDNRLPWRLPEDLKRFRDLTKNHTVIMGRRTYESIGKPLPDRNNIIITRNFNYSAPGCTVVNSLEDALPYAVEAEAFIIGGAEIYKAAIPYVNRMYLTYVHKQFQADTFFPDLNMKEWQIVSGTVGHRAESEPLIYSFIIYERRQY